LVHEIHVDPWFKPGGAMRNYKDLQVWQKAHSLTLSIYRATKGFPSDERFGLTSQIRRSTSSIGANLAEGCGRRSDGEMARFVQIAMGSGAELSYHMLLARDLGYLREDEYVGLESELGTLMRMLSAFSQRLRKPTERQVLSQEPRAKS
jgi:four helix bundle protein